MKTTSNLAEEIVNAVRASTEKENPSCAAVCEAGRLAGILAMLPNSEENRKFLEIVLASVSKQG